VSSDLAERGNALTLGATHSLDAEIRCRATRYAASRATDAQDCAELLAMLGLNPEDGKR